MGRIGNMWIPQLLAVFSLIATAAGGAQHNATGSAMPLETMKPQLGNVVGTSLRKASHAWARMLSAPASDEHGETVVEGHHILHEMLDWHWMLLFGGLIVALVLGHMMHHNHITWIPESIVVVGVGVVIGLLMEYKATTGFSKPQLDDWFSLINNVVLNLVLLPPIIFESGWSLRLKDFISQFRGIITFAVCGTLISTCLVSLGIHWTSSWHGIDSFPVAFTYAALISAVDPVATLACYSSLKVEPLLNIMVFGESTINDAVAIALFRAGDAVKHDAAMDWWAMAGTVLWLLIGSAVLGVLIAGFVSMIILKTGGTHSAGFSAALLSMTSWFTYVFAEGVAKCSGIISCLFAGATLSMMLRPYFGKAPLELVSFQLKQNASLADFVIFLMVGIAAVITTVEGDMWFSLYIAILCLIGRACSVFPLGYFVNSMKRRRARRNNLTDEDVNVLSMSHLFMMWCAGLRGGIAMALVLSMTSLDGKDDQAGKLRHATLFVIVSFLCFFGGTTKIFLDKLGIPTGCDADEDALAKGAVTELQMGNTMSQNALRASCRYLDSFAVVGNENPMERVMTSQGSRRSLGSDLEPDTADAPGQQRS